MFVSSLLSLFHSYLAFSEAFLILLIRYIYSYFGSSSPVITYPPIMVQRGSEVLLPNSFCKFEFASTLQLLQTTFSRLMIFNLLASC